eukprot:TRINITY_DN21592_c0_g1_i8.p2 TRINITY_DN21592_c0_g1~~TRINITY_DN21592_c0_g1_i8.p2  ORF type:complete len:347 (+),score=-13.55 TRINITY_DN21592_c0_g1_i8:438-1478(+)
MHARIVAQSQASDVYIHILYIPRKIFPVGQCDVFFTFNFQLNVHVNVIFVDFESYTKQQDLSIVQNIDFWNIYLLYPIKTINTLIVGWICFSVMFALLICSKKWLLMIIQFCGVLTKRTSPTVKLYVYITHVIKERFLVRIVVVASVLGILLLLLNHREQIINILYNVKLVDFIFDINQMLQSFDNFFCCIVEFKLNLHTFRLTWQITLKKSEWQFCSNCFNCNLRFTRCKKQDNKLSCSQFIPFVPITKKQLYYLLYFTSENQGFFFHYKQQQCPKQQQKIIPLQRNKELNKEQYLSSKLQSINVYMRLLQSGYSPFHIAQNSYCICKAKLFEQFLMQRNSTTSR